MLSSVLTQLLLLLLPLQSCLTLCDPTDGSPPGCPIPGILQARTLEWGAIAFSESKHETEDKNGLKQSRERRGSFRWEEL